MAQYSFFVLKVLLSTSQPSQHVLLYIPSVTHQCTEVT